jgi:hypothetical protein
MAPCEHLHTEGQALSPSGLDELAGQIDALQAQIEELRLTAESLAATVDALRGQSR